MDERKFSRLESIASLSALAAWNISPRDFFTPDFGGFFGHRYERSDYSPYRRKRERKADPVKKAARKRQKQARAKTRRNR